jgi:hypothetical protein
LSIHAYFGDQINLQIKIGFICNISLIHGIHIIHRIISSYFVYYKIWEMGWHVAGMWEKRIAYRLLVGEPEEDKDVGDWIILRWILERWVLGALTGLVSFWKEAVDICCEGGNEPSDCIECWEVLEWLHNRWPLKHCSALQS